MKWNVSQIHFQRNVIYEPKILITGFSQENENQVFDASIERTTLDQALSEKNNIYKVNGDYHEGYGLSVVSPDEVYIIHITFFQDMFRYHAMKQLPFCDMKENKYFDQDFYMSLPLTTFLMWKSMMQSDL